MKSKLFVKFANNFFDNMAEQEAELAKTPGAACPTEDSPVRFEIIREKLKRADDKKPIKLIPVMMHILLGVNRSIKSLKNNPTQPKTHIDDQLLRELEEYVISVGACSLGYTKLPPSMGVSK